MYVNAVNISVAQPQTCSRLFRPWDGQQDSTVSSSMTPSRNTLTPVDSVLSSPMNDTSLRTHEWSSADSRTSNDTTDLSEIEENIKITDEGKPDDKMKSVYSNAISPPTMSMKNMTTPQTMSPIDHAQLYHFQQLQHQAFYYGLPAISPFFGLDTAGNPLMSGPSMALAGSNMSMASSAMVASGSTMAMGSGMDPMTMGAVGHEYARILAEEAQAKLMSARKQRPKKFKCTYCEVAFSNNGQLKGHVRIHTGERPFKCDQVQCGKTFTRNEELTRHKRIHTGQRPYECPTCGKAFGRRDHLKKHTKTHYSAQEQYYTTPAAFFLPNPMHYTMYGC